MISIQLQNTNGSIRELSIKDNIYLDRLEKIIGEAIDSHRHDDDIDLVVNVVCNVFNVTVEEMRSENRKEEYRMPRFMISSILYNHYGYKTAAIGLAIDRERTGINNAIKGHEGYMFSKKHYRDRYDRVREILNLEK